MTERSESDQKMITVSDETAGQAIRHPDRSEKRSESDQTQSERARFRRSSDQTPIRTPAGPVNQDLAPFFKRGRVLTKPAPETATSTRPNRALESTPPLKEAHVTDPDPESTQSLAAEMSDAIRAMVDAANAQAAAEAAHVRRRTGVIDVLRGMRATVETPRDPRLMATVRHLYWQHPSLHSADIQAAAGFGTTAEMLKAIGPVRSGYFCEHCGEELRRTSRSWMPNRYRVGPVLCPTCERTRRDQDWRANELHWTRQRFVDSSGVTAPVRDWQVAVTLVLAYPPLAVSSYVPPDEDNDSFWHSYEVAKDVGHAAATYDPDADMTVLLGYATTLVKAAEKVAGWDTARTCQLAEPFTDEAATFVLSRLKRTIATIRKERQADALTQFPDPKGEHHV